MKTIQACDLKNGLPQDAPLYLLCRTALHAFGTGM